MWDWAVSSSRKDTNVYNSYAVGKYIELYAKELGFVYEGINSNERYNRVFHHTSNPKFKFYTDGTWLEGYLHNFDSLIRYAKRNKCSITNTEFLKQLSPIELDLLEDIQKYRTQPLEFRPLNLNPNYRSIIHLYDLYNSITVETLSEKLADLLHFAHTMFLCNRMFIPQMSGTQTGEYGIQKQMYQKAIKVCNTVINQYK